MRFSHLFLVFFLYLSTCFAQDPDILFLTWKGDPSTTMTVMWHTATGNGPSVVHYQAPNSTTWQKAEGSSYQMEHSNIKVHQVELTNLTPDTEYVFRLEGGEIHKLRTMPDGLTRTIHAAIGGDAYFSKEINHKMNLEVASRDPDFVILIGDIAYTEGLRTALRTHHWRLNRWEEFFKYWSEDMVTKDGRLIPIMPGLGNHDVKEGFDNPHKQEVFFFKLFAFPTDGIGYQLFKIGRDLCFYILDSGHSAPIGGAQAEWLKKNLKSHQDALYHIPAYHIGAYPSETAYTHRGSKDVRKFWVPLFEKYGVKISMEHDNHTFKRTFPIWKGMVDVDGIYYLGDGAWGVYPDKPHRHWYLAKALQTNCYWLLTIDKSQTLAEAFDIDGELIDKLSIEPNR